jgi:DNA-binding transcriptional LysR family regulator
MAEINLRRISYLIAVAEEGSVSKAAERLGMTQPALGRQVAELEKALGTPLVNRSNRGSALTLAGTGYVREVRPLLNRLDQANRKVTRNCDGTVRIAIGFVGSMSASQIPKIVSAYREAAPGVTLHLEESNNEGVLRNLHEGRIDIGFMALPIRDETLRMKLLYRESLLAVMPNDHPLACQETIPAELLAKQSLILCPRESAIAFYDSIRLHLAPSGQRLNVVQEVEGKQILAGLVRAGVGLSILPASFAHTFKDGLVHRPVVPAFPQAEMAAVWRSENASAIMPLVRVAYQCCSTARKSDTA